MPKGASPVDFERYVREIYAFYAEAEQVMLEKVRRRLERGIDSPGWAERKLAELTQLRRELEDVLRLLRKGELEAAKAVLEAYRDGAAQAVFDFEEANQGAQVTIQPGGPGVSVNKATVDALTQRMTSNLQATHLRVLRAAQDAYREAVAQGTGASMVTGARNRVEAVQDVLNRFADRGITGFVDKAGRNWDLASYAEMAVRSATGQAGVQGHVDTLLAQGYDRVIVSDSPEECDVCRPWERKVLALTEEAARKYGIPTLQAAIEAGLLHPNCTHRLGAYIDGLTEIGTADHNPQGYEERQRQRHMERQVRKWKRRLTVAMTPEEERKAKAKVKEWQTAIRAFVDDTGRLRRSDREQVRTGKAGVTPNFR